MHACNSVLGSGMQLGAQGWVGCRGGECVAAVVRDGSWLSEAHGLWSGVLCDAPTGLSNWGARRWQQSRRCR
jgi:hypothetical protein